MTEERPEFVVEPAQSGSPAELHEWQGMVHVFPLRAAREALDITGEFLRRNLDTPDHRTAILPPPAWRKEMTRILFVGQKPETVDFSDPSLPPGFNAEKWVPPSGYLCPRTLPSGVRRTTWGCGRPQALLVATTQGQRLAESRG
jgi:hypothetical protein